MKVLRLDVGADVILLDGEGGLYHSQIQAINKQDLVCTPIDFPGIDGKRIRDCGVIIGADMAKQAAIGIEM